MTNSRWQSNLKQCSLLSMRKKPKTVTLEGACGQRFFYLLIHSSSPNALHPDWAGLTWELHLSHQQHLSRFRLAGMGNQELGTGIELRHSGMGILTTRLKKHIAHISNGFCFVSAALQTDSTAFRKVGSQSHLKFTKSESKF